MTPKGWVQSPADNINPSIDKEGLALNIDMDNNALDFDLARSIGDYFHLASGEMDQIFQEVQNAVKDWETVAKQIGVPNSEQVVMFTAFRFK